MIGDVVFWAGGVFAVIALVYYFFQPHPRSADRQQ